MDRIGFCSRWSLAVVAGLAVFSVQEAEAQCPPQFLWGELTTHEVDCATLCTVGTLTGGLSGTLEFTMTSMTPTSQPDVFDYTGVNVITTSHGTLSGVDHGLWNIATGEFIDYTPLGSGTGDYSGAHGALTIIGTFDVVAGGHSHYSAVLNH